MLPIVVVPAAVLRQPAQPVTQIDKRLGKIIKDMTSALLSAHDPEGVGLAAPQVGLSLRLFLIRPDLKKTPRVFINPEIVKISQRLQSPESKDGVYEGCLSIPGHYAPIKRAMSVTVKYQAIEKSANNEQLITKNEVFTGFSAHIIQHELDHLNGILFIDHVLSQDAKLYKLEGKSWSEVQL